MSEVIMSFSENQTGCCSGGDHQLTQSESGVELKCLLKLIDSVIEMSPATDDEPEIMTTKKFIPNSTTENPEIVKLTETLMIPVKKFPKYNFVGRILGPRGMTVKQLEKETGCKIFVRGRASSVSFNPHNKAHRVNVLNQKATLSNISKNALTEEPLHVYIECQDFPACAAEKMAHAVSIIRELLSPPADGKDELKRQQLVDISLINGTYRATNASNEVVRQFNRQQWRQTVDPTSHPVDIDLKSFGIGDHGAQSNHCAFGDVGTVYEIPQQKRVWQKPRGPDASSDEYAKSVSSRELVTDMVNKTKKSSTKNSSGDTVLQLPDSVVSETLKVAQTLLASHQHFTFPVGASPHPPSVSSHSHQNPPSIHHNYMDHQNRSGTAGDYRHNGFSFISAATSSPHHHQHSHYQTGGPPPLLSTPAPFRTMHDRPCPDYPSYYLYSPPPQTQPSHFSARRY